MTGIIQHTGETKIQVLRLIVIRDNRRDIIQNTAIISAVRIMLLLVVGIVMVTAMSVIPLSGDQFVRPMPSESITPAIQIQSVPKTAINAPRGTPTSFVDKIAVTNKAIAAPTAIPTGPATEPAVAPVATVLPAPAAAAERRTGLFSRLLQSSGGESARHPQPGWGPHLAGAR